MCLRLLPLLVMPAVFAGDWVRLRASDVEVITNEGDDAGKEALTRLAQIRQVLAIQSGAPTRLRRSVRIFIFASDADFVTFQPARVHNPAGWYQSGPALDIIGIRGRLSPRMYHEFAHLFQNQSSGTVPVWYGEGFSDLYSTLHISGHHVEVGDAPAERVEALKATRWLTLDELLTVNEDSPWYRDRAKAELFYAESWALVHMLTFDEEYRANLAEFLRRFQSGRAQLEALRIAFGRSPETIYDDLRRYVRNGRYATKSIDLPGLADVKAADPETLSPLESSLVLVDLLSAVSKGAEAERRLHQLSAKYDSTPDLHEQWAAVLLAEGKLNEASQQYTRAQELGSKNASAAFELAGLLRDAKADPARVIELLDKAIHLDPDFMQARILLGVIHEREGRYAQAAHQLEIAVRAKPDSLNAWHELAVVRFHLGERDAALNAAREARKLARSPEEIAMTEATVQLVRSPATSAVVEPDREKHFEDTFREVVPKTWVNPQGNSRVEGKLVQLDCLAGGEARFHIVALGKKVALYVKDPTKVVITGAAGISTELKCGAMPGREVSVEYVVRPDVKLKVDGEITAIQFK